MKRLFAALAACLMLAACDFTKNGSQIETQKTDTIEVVVDTIEETVNDSIVELVVDEPAQFPGGMEALVKYVSENTEYPEDAKENEQYGKVLARFDIAKDGNVENIAIVSGVCESIDNEVVRMIESMPRWTPAVSGDSTVRTSFFLPVVFKLEADETNDTNK